MDSFEKIPRTKQALQQALHQLLLTTLLSDITVTLLCQTAGVGRATFYRSYSEPLDVIVEEHNDTLLRYRSAHMPEELTDKKLLMRGIRHIIETPERKMLHLHVLSSLTEEQRRKLCHVCLFQSIFLSRMPEHTSHWFCLVIMDVLFAWLENGDKTPEQLAELLISFAKATGEWEERT